MRVGRCLALAALLVAAGCSGVFSGADPGDYFVDPRLVQVLDAAADGDSERIRELVDSGVDLDSPGNDHDPRRPGITPLLYAVEFLRPSAVGAMLEAGADPLTGMDGYNAAGYSILRDRLPALEVLLSSDPTLADAPDRLGGNVVHTAVLNRNTEALEMLLTTGAGLDTQQRTSNRTALHVAASIGNIDHCLLLIRAGADAGLRDVGGGLFLRPLFRGQDRIRSSEFLSGREELIAELTRRGFPLDR